MALVGAGRSDYWRMIAPLGEMCMSEAWGMVMGEVLGERTGWGSIAYLYSGPGSPYVYRFYAVLRVADGAPTGFSLVCAIGH